MNIIDLAYQIIDMQHKIDEQERQIARLKHFETEYNSLLNAMLEHNRTMMDNMVKVCMQPGVAAELGKLKDPFCG